MEAMGANSPEEEEEDHYMAQLFADLDAAPGMPGGGGVGAHAMLSGDDTFARIFDSWNGGDMTMAVAAAVAGGGGGGVVGEGKGETSGPGAQHQQHQEQHQPQQHQHYEQQPRQPQQHHQQQHHQQPPQQQQQRTAAVYGLGLGPCSHEFPGHPPSGPPTSFFVAPTAPTSAQGVSQSSWGSVGPAQPNAAALWGGGHSIGAAIKVKPEPEGSAGFAGLSDPEGGGVPGAENWYAAAPAASLQAARSGNSSGDAVSAGKPISSAGRRKSIAAGGSGSVARVPVSRYRQRKGAMDSLEAEAASKLEQARSMEEENRRLRLRTCAMEHTLAARDKQLSILTQFQEMKSAVGEAANSQEARFMKQAAENPVSVLASKLHTFFKEATGLLLRVSDAESHKGVDQDALDTLSNMVSSFCTEMGTAFVLSPHKQFMMLAMRATHPDAPAPLPPPGHWNKVVTELAATRDQLDEVCSVWALNGALLSKIEAEVIAERGELAAVMEAGTSQIGSSDQISGLQRRLATSLLNQGMTCRAMGFILFGRIFSPLQTARALVHSFPYFPNAREIVTRLTASSPDACGM
ncbi:hypothetical protein FOA52_005460 [Chlamydomonas sp. UWO 241]|nr:hypothetical protein FOA52_005460 [Chlamydomonas sp. UWO 241]